MSLIERLKNPEDHYEFTDTKKANAVLMSLCQEAADALAAPVQEPEQWGHLKVYGYAPGDYMMTCRGCNTEVIGVDKRASRCKPCASKAAAQPAPTVQEPVAIGWDTKTDTPIMGYTTPPAAQRPFVGLTDKQMVDAIEPLYLNRSTAEMAAKVSMDEFRAIEAKLKEKNNG